MKKANLKSTAISLHRSMWNWIADWITEEAKLGNKFKNLNIDDLKKLYIIEQHKLDCTHPYFEKFSNPIFSCFLCEYSMIYRRYHNRRCISCPLIWFADDDEKFKDGEATCLDECSPLYMMDELLISEYIERFGEIALIENCRKIEELEERK